MRSIKILDCTLRDGGYINNWKFGYKNIKQIISNLNDSNVDIIECGFIRDKNENVFCDIDYSNFLTFESLIKYGKTLFKKNKSYSLMMLAEQYSIENLNFLDQKFVDIIRLSFHKTDLEKGIMMSKIIKEKGYRLFLQPTVTMGYTDDEIIALLNKCNDIKPESVAIVDTFGEMFPNDVIWLTKLFDKYLDKDITISFHAHNNIQTAFCNAILFINNVSSDRNIIIDSSIYGMGRGAGNLPTELILDYLNKSYNGNYNLLPILNTVDEILLKVKKDNFWGYSLEFYLSSIYHCHPKYALYLSSNKTLTTSDISFLLGLISEDKRNEFDLDYVHGLYKSFCEKRVNFVDNYGLLKNLIGGKNILLIGPGSSIIKQKKLISSYVNDSSNYYSIAINSNLIFNTNAVFCSNRKRFNELTINNNKKKYIFTSNVKNTQDDDLIFDYQECLANEFENSDNSLLMLLKILKKCNIKNNILLAGFDGFYVGDNNFYNNDIEYIIDKNKINELNRLLSKYISLYKKDLNIVFLTESLYDYTNN